VQEHPRTNRQRWRFRPSFSTKLTLLGILLLVIPVIAYGRLRRADEIQEALLLRSVRDQGHLAAAALAPQLRSSETAALPQLNQELERFSGGVGSFKLLLEPTGKTGFYYVASWPMVLSSQLDAERAALSEAGVLTRLASSCQGDEPLQLHYRVPERDDEIVASVTPVRTDGGCWVVVTTLSAGSLPGLNIGQLYWQSRDVRLTAAIYLAMIAITFTTFWSIRRGLKRFVEHARAIGDHRANVSFAEQNDVPDLAEVAAEFDHMVNVLATSARNLRRAAEDNAHAFKTPIAVIRQSLEPLRRTVSVENQRGTRALGLIENSLDKLDGLVASARRLDEAAALLMDVPRSNLDLSKLLGRILDAYADGLTQRGVGLRWRLAANVMVYAHEEMIETVLDNLLDNAVSFSPRDAHIDVVLAARGDSAEIVIGDSGPGVPQTHVERIFERYFSFRQSDADAEEDPSHFGVGLWIAKRNVEALGGTITAQNRSPNGLLVRITLALAGRRPLAKPRTGDADTAEPADIRSLPIAASEAVRAAAYANLRRLRHRRLAAGTAVILVAFAAGWAALSSYEMPRVDGEAVDHGRSTPSSVAARNDASQGATPQMPANGAIVTKEGAASVETVSETKDEANSAAVDATPAQNDATAAAALAEPQPAAGPPSSPPPQVTIPLAPAAAVTDTETQQITAFLAARLAAPAQGSNPPGAKSPTIAAAADDARAAPDASTHEIADFLPKRLGPVAAPAVDQAANAGGLTNVAGSLDAAEDGVQAASPSPASATGETDARYVVQVGAFHDEGLARRLADLLTSKNMTVFITRSIARDGGVWFILRTGKFATAEDADKAQSSIRSIADVAPVVIHFDTGRAP
jgi:two-component system sensor histidine kinase ChvG